MKQKMSQRTGNTCALAHLLYAFLFRRLDSLTCPHRAKCACCTYLQFLIRVGVYDLVLVQLVGDNRQHFRFDRLPLVSCCTCYTVYSQQVYNPSSLYCTYCTRTDVLYRQSILTRTLIVQKMSNLLLVFS